jgi:hypothetical protein
MKHATVMIPVKTEIKRRESGKNQRKVMASYSIGLSTINDPKKQRD